MYEQPATGSVADTTASLLRTIVAAATDQVAADITPGMRLEEDLGVDSLEMASVLVDIENAFGVVIDASALTAIHTVGELQQAVQQRAGRP